MKRHYPVTASLENQLHKFDNPVAKMIIELVREYELGELGSADMVFEGELGARLKLTCPPEELSNFCLRLYSAVAKDIAMFARDHDFEKYDRERTNAISALLAEFERKMHNRDEHDEPLDDGFDPTEVLEKLLKAGWDPKSANASGWTMLHDLAGDETIDAFEAASAITWLLEHGANANATNASGVSPLHLAAITGFGVVSTLLEFGADKTLRTTSPTQIPIYAARGLVTVPAGSTAYDLAEYSDLPEETVAELFCDAG